MFQVTRNLEFSVAPLRHMCGDESIRPAAFLKWTCIAHFTEIAPINSPSRVTLSHWQLPRWKWIAEHYPKPQQNPSSGMGVETYACSTARRKSSPEWPRACSVTPIETNASQVKSHPARELNRKIYSRYPAARHGHAELNSNHGISKQSKSYVTVDRARLSGTFVPWWE
jgi:hypothetical protein